MRILLAEDDSHISQIARITLEKLGKHKVTIVENGKDCLEKIQGDEFDLILLDGMMPIMDGITVLKKLNEFNIKIPVIFLSAKSQEVDIKEVLELGAIGYITKPFDPKVLNQQILAYYEGRSSA